MDLSIRGKKAVVTGSTAGIGYAIAVALAKEGASVILNGRSQQRVDDALRKINTAVPSASVTGIAADLATAQGCDAFVKAIPDAAILINNLGIFEPVPFEKIPDADWFRFFETNVMSGVRLSRHYLPKMLAANWGRILFISSESALQIPSEMIHYGMTKTAQIAVARGLAELSAGTNVTVNSVLAGPTASEGVEGFVKQMAKEQKMDVAQIEKWFFKEVRPTSLIKRFESPDEIASVCAFLCSPLASAINGSAIRAEGGVVKSAF